MSQERPVSPDGIEVVDDAAGGRFVVVLNGAEAELVYALQPGRIVLVHTGVPEELEGHGIGTLLVRTALSRARTEGLVIVPRCPFARGWLAEHPDQAASVEIDWEGRPPGGRLA